MKRKIIHYYQKCRGSIALISVLVISAVVLILTLGLSEINISTSYQYLNNSSNKTAYYAAEACFEEAVIRLEKDISFTTTTITIDPDTSCLINVSGLDLNISVDYLDYNQSFLGAISINAIGQANNVTLLSWEEI